MELQDAIGWITLGVGVVFAGVACYLAIRREKDSPERTAAHVPLFAGLAVALLLGSGVAFTGGLTLELGGGTRQDDCSTPCPDPSAT